MPFTFMPLRLPEVVLIVPKIFPDERGFFLETYKASEFHAHGIRETFTQDNHSYSTRGVLRGLHYQRPPKAQAKLVQVVRGEVFDVSVDIRHDSPTYGQWVGVTLSATNGHLLYVPCGFAHGFCVLSETADVVYKVSTEYAPETEGGIRWDDPDLSIDWPVASPELAWKDTQYPSLKDSDSGF